LQILARNLPQEVGQPLEKEGREMEKRDKFLTTITS
jgi:hypothetical protein